MLLHHEPSAWGTVVPLDGPAHPQQASPRGVGAVEPGAVRTERAPDRALRQGIPSLLEWIDEAEAVHRPLAGKMLIGMLLAVIAFVMASHLGWLSS